MENRLMILECSEIVFEGDRCLEFDLDFSEESDFSMSFGEMVGFCNSMSELEPKLIVEIDLNFVTCLF
jgi:hypothetical protein